MAKRKYCEWCGGSTKNPPLLVSKIPILEPIEELIDENDRCQILEDYYTGDDIEINDKQVEITVISYLDLMSDLQNKVICDSCINKNDKDELKYYKYDDFEDFEGEEIY